MLQPGQLMMQTIGGAIEAGLKEAMREPTPEEKREQERQEQLKREQQEREKKQRELQELEARLDPKDIQNLRELVMTTNQDIVNSAIMEALNDKRSGREVNASTETADDDVVNLVGVGEEGQMLARQVQDEAWLREYFSAPQHSEQETTDTATAA
ncbi:MAG: hypothetical protein KDD62_02025 [Bdellovibrionales bacterium]|nr:hypothetical protein [Bdellovibrionales bacterium]